MPFFILLAFIALVLVIVGGTRNFGRRMIVITGFAIAYMCTFVVTGFVETMIFGGRETTLPVIVISSLIVFAIAYRNIQKTGGMERLWNAPQ